MNATKTNCNADLDILYVSKEYFGTGLKCLDMLIISTIEEYEKRNEECYLTNKTLSNMFHRSESTIKRTIDKLEKYFMNYNLRTCIELFRDLAHSSLPKVELTIDNCGW